MAGYIIVDVKTRKVLLICGAVGLFLFILGIIIGHFSAIKSTTTTSSSSSCSLRAAMETACPLSNMGKEAKTYLERYAENRADDACVDKTQDCLNHGIPRHYIAYHLNGKQIAIDGKLDDQAWEEVPWTESLVDMRSEVYPAPRFDTKVKIRWDDTQIYIGAYVQDKDLWGTMTAHDSPVYKDNGFEMLMDVDGTMHNYKQVQINVLGTVYDLMHLRSPYDANNMTTVDESWTVDTKSKVFTEGTVNTPGDVDKFWSVEMTLSIQKLFQRSGRSSAALVDGETWFMQFGRSEWTLDVTNNKYVNTGKVDWWSWQACNTINLHLQDRWGLVQFKKDVNDKTFAFEKWHIYKALIDMMNGLKAYQAVNGKYTTQVEELSIPAYLFSGTCVELPIISLNKRGNISDFEVTVKSAYLSHPPAHIRSDRYVWFK